MESPDTAETAAADLQATFAAVQRVAVEGAVGAKILQAYEAMQALIVAKRALNAARQSADAEAAMEAMQMAVAAMQAGAAALPVPDMRAAAASMQSVAASRQSLATIMQKAAKVRQEAAAALMQDGLAAVQRKALAMEVENLQTLAADSQASAADEWAAIAAMLSVAWHRIWEATEALSVLFGIAAPPLAAMRAAAAALTMVPMPLAGMRAELEDVQSSMSVVLDTITNASIVGFKNENGREQARRTRHEAKDTRADEWQRLADPIWARNPSWSTRAVAKQVRYQLADQNRSELRVSSETIRKGIQRPS